MKPSNVRIMRNLKAAIVRDVPRRERAKAIIIKTAVAVLAVIFVSCANHDPATEHRATPHDDSPIGCAFASTSDVQVEGQGTMIRVLPNDVDGSRHQRFIVQLALRETLLITQREQTKSGHSRSIPMNGIARKELLGLHRETGHTEYVFFNDRRRIHEPISSTGLALPVA